MIATAMFLYGFYGSIPHLRNWYEATRGKFRPYQWTWKDETAYLSLILSQFVFAGAVIGARFGSL